MGEGREGVGSKLDFRPTCDKVHEMIVVLARTRIGYGSSHWKLAERHVSLAEDDLELQGEWGPLGVRAHSEGSKI